MFECGAPCWPKVLNKQGLLLVIHVPRSAHVLAITVWRCAHLGRCLGVLGQGCQCSCNALPPPRATRALRTPQRSWDQTLCQVHKRQQAGPPQQGSALPLPPGFDLQLKQKPHGVSAPCRACPCEFRAQAKIVAMTCTHAALKRREFIDLAFKYDNLLMEESGQILEIETFIPMLLQVRCCLPQPLPASGCACPW